MLFETKLTQVFAELQTQDNVPNHSISYFWKYLNAKIIPQPFTRGFTIAIVVLAIFDSPIALAIQSTNNRNSSVSAQDARIIYVIFTEIHNGYF